MLVCTIKRRVWFWKVWRAFGRNGCAAVAQVPIQRLASRSASALRTGPGTPEAGIAGATSAAKSNAAAQTTLVLKFQGWRAATIRCLFLFIATFPLGVTTVDGCEFPFYRISQSTDYRTA